VVRSDDEADHPAHRNDRTDEQGGGHEDVAARAVHVDAQLQCRFLAQRKHVHVPCLPRQPQRRRQGVQGDTRYQPIALRGEAAINQKRMPWPGRSRQAS